MGSVDRSAEALENLNDEWRVKLFGSRLRGYVPHLNVEYRLLIIEENAEMACRQRYRTILDYSGRRNAFITSSELKQYIYGSPIRSKSRETENKIRLIPNSRQLLVTRIFYPKKGSVTVSPALSTTSTSTSSNKKGMKMKGNTNNYKSTDSRVSITLCLPSYLLADISDTWSEIDGWLTQTERHLMATSFHVVETQQNFFVELVNKLLIPALRSCHEIPRLLLYPLDNIEFIHSWFKDVFNWIEMKEGTKLNFLPYLIAKTLIDYRKEEGGAESSRIVITSGNMVIANKLVFILSGLLNPRYDSEVHIIDENIPAAAIKVAPSHHPESHYTDVDPQSHSSNIHHTPIKPKIPATIMERRISRHSVGNIEQLHVPSHSMDIPSTKIDHSPFSTSKGWKIPSSHRSATSSVSISSGESLAEVIQPSSLKSLNTTSLHNFSSSLSNQLGTSYGSWFNGSITGSFSNINPISSGTTTNTIGFSNSFKKNNLSALFQNSPSSAGTDGWDRIGTTTTNTTLQRTTSNSSLRHLVTPYQQQLTSPSTNSEYEEYPWFGAGGSNNGGTTAAASNVYATASQPLLQNHNNNLDPTTMLNNIRNGGNNTVYTFPLKNVEFERNSSAIDHHELLKNCFDEIFDGPLLAHKVDTMVPCRDIAPHIHDGMHGDSSSITEHQRSTIDVAITTGEFPQYPQELLPRYTMYLSGFNPFFRLQAIPASKEIETSIVHGLKRDFVRDNCQVSRTLCVSMRSRSIKEIIVRKTSSLPTSSQASASSEDRRSRNSRGMLKQKVKKIFANGNSMTRVTPVMNNCIAFIEAALKSAMSLYSDPTIDRKYRDERIKKIFLAVVHYNTEA
ncbi:Protein LST4 [Nakaseomyces bracarensis]|uniref:Protein LST4 n=1 Tax=Nakaseomyces bracarensis TaxID=273131 RepID=A0ABR4NNS8_9SACH